MKDLIEALQILLKYGNPDFPTNCSHDELYITSDIDPSKVSAEDVARLEELGFELDEELNQFYSYKFGSC